MIRLGLNIADYRGDRKRNAFERLAELVVAGEAAGFDSFFAGDHLMSDKAAPDGQWLELYTTLAALAARTTSIKFGALVGAVLFRNPALLAKTVTSLDVISHGRAIFGIGSGSHEGEHRAYGYDFPPPADRLAILEETVALVKAMFGGGPTTVAGKWVRTEAALNQPPPITPGGPPVMIGGTGRRTLRLVARYGDIANFAADDKLVPEINAVLDEHCADIGRDPSTITRTMFKPVILAKTRQEAEAVMTPWQREHQDLLGIVTGGPDDVAGQFRDLRNAGIDGLIVQLPAAHNTADRITELGHLLSPIVADGVPAVTRGEIDGATRTDMA
ncbi:LLM class flavin-dependent oxidoreductase [Mycobacterium sp. CVI_P3]|uniref:LLM class flavin-dependent oxidoreductase n=1 Tax=Mycobacterium pinniadriaticum TaxID=2994102 RepID=A0ABT3SGA1_9MYCO|nr:LLM class flavin-dependent oxidoreductase [Mycobacterium pinniadriaticum]MCX2931752.1 LLM class flavin-dependent oxidoreductase [Mycobacterium pinniadriaticum]MCX2938173.1 LLM class flavin-dependent oxidoreductase [Mycobacterium pinniadriaticum]